MEGVLTLERIQPVTRWGEGEVVSVVSQVTNEKRPCLSPNTYRLELRESPGGRFSSQLHHVAHTSWAGGRIVQWEKDRTWYCTVLSLNLSSDPSGCVTLDSYLTSLETQAQETNTEAT